MRVIFGGAESHIGDIVRIFLKIRVVSIGFEINLGKSVVVSRSELSNKFDNKYSRGQCKIVKVNLNK